MFGYYFMDKFKDVIKKNDLQHVKNFILKHKYNTNEYERAFRYTCEHGHLKIVQLLLNLIPNINVSACNDYAFYFACKNKHIK